MTQPVAQLQCTESELYDFSLRNLSQEDYRYCGIYRESTPQQCYDLLSARYATILYREEKDDDTGVSKRIIQTDKIDTLRRIAACFRSIIFDTSVEGARLNWLVFFLDLQMPSFANRLIETFATKENVTMYEGLFLPAVESRGLDVNEAKVFMEGLKKRLT